MRIRKGYPLAPDKLSVLLDTLEFSPWIVPHKIGSEEVVNLAQISLVPDVFPYSLSQQLIVHCRHLCIAPFCSSGIAHHDGVYFTVHWEPQALW
jgi:hypothetical protein